MKAVPFLECIKGLYEVGADINQPYTAHENIVDLATFYSQPFKPELITELFEGWEHGNPPENLHFKQWWLYVVPAGKGLFQVNECNEELSNFKRRHESGSPSTLDRFIGHCEEAGIELEWKEEVVDKYFK